jgi:hypothetical protein
MSCKRFGIIACARLIACCCFAAFLTLAASVIAQENETPQRDHEDQADDTQEEPMPTLPDVEDVPSKAASDAARRLRDQKALLSEDTSQWRKQQRQYQALLQELEQQKRQLMSQQEQIAKQHAQAEQHYRQALIELEKARIQQQHQTDAQRPALEKQLQELEAARANLSQQMSSRQMMEMLHGRQEAVPRVNQGTFKVFALRYSKAREAAGVLSEVLSGQPMRLAVDDRTNSLVLFADEDTSKVAEALMQKLDQSIGDSKTQQPGKTLQLRIVWLVDGLPDGQGNAVDDFVSSDVRLALEKLGFVDPKVVAQQVNTLTVGSNRNAGGQFQFEVPVLIDNGSWQFRGDGRVSSMADDRFEVRFELNVAQSRDRQSQLGGSIYTPLGHYTVMGTTTFVRTDWRAPRDVQDAPPQRQHLSAFVVYLDRASEFPATKAEPAKK